MALMPAQCRWTAVAPTPKVAQCHNHIVQRIPNLVLAGQCHDQRIGADQRHGPQQRQYARGQPVSQHALLFAVTGGLIGGGVAINWDHQTLVDRIAKRHGKTGEKKGDIVDTQCVQRDKLAQNGAVALRGDEPKRGGQEDPFAKSHQVAGRWAIPTEPIAVSRQIQMGDRHIRQRLKYAPENQRHNRFGRDGHRDHDHQADQLAGQLQHGDTAHLQMPVRGFDAGGFKSFDYKGGAGNRKDIQQLGHRIKRCHRPGQNKCQPPQPNAAGHLDGPSRI
ncbi:hypothetical protein GQR58_030154 [Nymphon striatum]|nr:hypothetical protein GQR58_030154 [Nymphon striatum]